VIGRKEAKRVVPYLYVVEGDVESEEAIRLLKKSRIAFKKVAINANNNGKSMFRDLRTTEVPSLATSESVIIGLDSIKKFTEEAKQF
jgi:hypothetical protein